MTIKGPRPMTGAMRGEIQHHPDKLKKDVDDMNPDMNWGLGLARVTNIDYEEHYITLRTVVGTEQEFERIPTTMSYPAAGARHFLGAMPEVGDYCVVGWLPQESSQSQGTRTPVVISWVIPGVWPGRDWLTTASFTEDEHDGGTQRNREELRGIFERVRHKLRHIHPGNVVASSSQGSDLVLDESVTLANRRGNEFILRDSDQAAVLRACQHFIALAGTRSYSGMVQRDALSLPTTMFSDGKEWDGPVQAVAGVAVHESDLPSQENSSGYLDPAFPLSRRIEDVLGGSLFKTSEAFDPYVFLRNGGFIDEDGVAVDGLPENDAVYAGKNIYRVAARGTENTVLNPDAPTLTEHRIELAHTSTGRLPVTEQTDLFDAERLPPSDPDTKGDSSSKPYIEWVLGSVVGNDPYSAKGRMAYGVPLVAQVFDDLGGVSPMVGPARIAPEGQGVSTPLGEHAATLFQLIPISGRSAPSFVAMNKKGQYRISVSGPPTESSVDAALAGGLRLALGGTLDLQLKGGIHLGTLSKNSLRLRSEYGPVMIYGGGTDIGEESTLERLQGTNEGEGFVPSVDIHARTNARFRAEKQVLIKGKGIELNASNVLINGHDNIDIASAKKINVSSEDVSFTVSGKRSDNFTGPKTLLPTNFPLHERSYTPLYPGFAAEEVNYNMGNRDELFLLGNHTTTVIVGNLTYQTLFGIFTARSGANSLDVSPAGVSGTAAVGVATLTAATGAASMIGATGVLIQSGLGPVAVRSSTLLTLGAPIGLNDFGPIICAGSLEPLTNLPFITWGMGAKAHVVTL